MIMDSSTWMELKERYEKRQTLYWENLHVGMEFVPYTYIVTEEIAENVIQVTGNTNHLYSNYFLKPDGKRLCPLGCAVIYSRLSYLGEQYQPPAGGILANMSLKFKKPLCVGDIITSYAKVVSKEEGKGRKYFTLHIHSIDHNNEQVSEMEMTGIWPR